MRTAVASGLISGPSGGLLDRERIIAIAGFNRWLVPPAALAIHLCIGMAYGFSVFWLPLSRALGIQQSVACPDLTLIGSLFTTSCDWRIADLGWMYTLFFVFLGSSAALWGGWLERAGPRKAGVVAALCWCGGMLISAIGVYLHQLWLMWLGSGVIGAPLADMLMSYFRTPTDVGVWATFVTLAAIYFVFMLGGAFGYRVPPANWRPDGWTPPPETRSMITQHQVHLRDAHKTRAFWMIWLVLCLNVSAGIGVIGMASPMLQEIFGGSLLGLPDVGFAQLDPDQKKAIAAIAAGFTGLLSLFNIGGRFFWASISDHLGRKRTYYLFFLLGIALYALAPTAAHIGSKALFVLMFGVILSMYGGGFATVPAYLADIFGTQFVGAIHGRLLTAWSTAGIIGPVIVNYIREYEKSIGVPSDKLYDVTMYVLAGLLVLGLIANSLVRPLAERWYMRPDEVLALQPRTTVAVTQGGSYGIGRGGFDGKALVAWLLVGVPILWGVWVTLSKASVLFR